MRPRPMIAAALAVAACKQGRAAPPSSSPSMADLIAPADRRPAAPAPAAPDPAAARMEEAARAAQARTEPAAIRAELRARLGPPTFELDGWIEWVVADDEACDRVWLEGADARDVGHARYTSVDPDADVVACRALAAGDAHARIIASVARAHGAFASAAAARAWLRRNLGAPSRDLFPGRDHASTWARSVGDACFALDLDDARFDAADPLDRVLDGRGYASSEPEYVGCKRWSEVPRG